MDDQRTQGTLRRILIADPHPVYRLGIAALLAAAQPGWEIVETATLDMGGTLPHDGAFNLLLIDARMLGTAFAQRPSVRSRFDPPVAIVAITDKSDPLDVLGCIAAGAQETIARTDPAPRVLAVIEAAVLMPREAWPAPSPVASPSETGGLGAGEVLSLTSRQLDVLRLLALGQSNKVIARDLGLSVSTVKVHLNTVFRALGARNRVEAVVRARPFQSHLPRPHP